MRSTGWWWSVVLLVSLTSAAPAQQAGSWQWDVESAKRLAAQSNRLVLIHFWADWCGPCRAMDRDVFSRPDVLQALDSRFVRVKVHKDQHPELAKQYGITGIPADVIVTPQGQMVEKFVGATDANQYVAKLTQAANRAGGPTQAIAQIPGGPAGPATSGGSWGQQQVPGQIVSQPYGPIASNIGGTFTAPNSYLPASPPMQPIYTGPPGQPMQPEVNVNTYQPQQAAPPMMASQPYAPPMGQTTAMIPQQPAAVMQPQPPVAAPAGQLPPGSPPLAMDGFCPVQLAEKEHWVPGNTLWGAVHEGRTYLFAGPEEQKRFLADPNRFAPRFAGDDVVLMVETQQRVPGHREYGAWYRGSVYLFSSEATFVKFDQDPTRYLGRLEGNLAGRPGMMAR